MSQVNVTLERMTHQRALSSIGGAYVYAALVVAGPWIFTVLGIVGLSSASCTAGCEELPVFRSVVIYNSLFSLVVTSPIAFFSGRYVSDQMHLGQPRSVSFVLVMSLSAFCLVTLATAVPFYLLATTLDGPAQVSAIQNAVLLGISWLLIPFLSVTRAHNTIIAAFGTNAALMVLLGTQLTTPSATTLLTVFNASFALTDAMLIGTVIRQFGNRLQPDPGMFRFAPWKWQLPLAGLAYATGIWADKIIMWFAVPSGGLTVAGTLRTMPSYDTAMFWAQLASVPVIAVAFVHVETGFYHLLGRFYGRLDQQASLRELMLAMERLRAAVISNLVGMFVALGIVAAMTVLISFVFMTELGLRPSYMSILRISLCAMVFHTSSMFCFMFLLYFDLRRPALLIVSTYLVLNASLTLLFLSWGQAFYGYGSMVSAALTFLLALTIVLRELHWLHYHAFVTNNVSL